MRVLAATVGENATGIEPLVGMKSRRREIVDRAPRWLVMTATAPATNSRHPNVNQSRSQANSPLVASGSRRTQQSRLAAARLCDDDGGSRCYRNAQPHRYYFRAIRRRAAAIPASPNPNNDSVDAASGTDVVSCAPPMRNCDASSNASAPSA